MRVSTMLLACSLALGACVDVAYTDGAGGAATTGAAGPGGAGGSTVATTTSSSSSSSSGGSAQGGGGGSSPCVPSTESCNGSDDDCDGLTDEPADQLPGNACGCDWTFDPGGRAYALCSAAGQSFDTVPCPGGTKKVVLQSATEQLFVTSWLSPLLAAQAYAFIGLRQAADSPTVAAGWSWPVASTEPAGMVPPWTSGQPNDQGQFEPTEVEDGGQDCGGLGRFVAAAPVAVLDTDCASAAHVVCEQASPQPCTPGGSCLLAEGCHGTFDCNQPVGSECVAAPQGESCNGDDDNCDGQVDASLNGHACGCVAFTNSATSRDYKVCSTNRRFAEAECGPGYRLAVVGDAAEQTYLAGLTGGTQYLIGLFQRTDATLVGEQWFWVDGNSLATPIWAGAQPDDAADATEEDEENCAVLEGPGWYDRPCGNTRPYICEEI